MHPNLTNTLIFAIRHWQRTGHTGDYPDLEDGNPNILEDDELDEICEGLNLGMLAVTEVPEPNKQYWIVSGRQHGPDTEEEVAHIVTEGEEDPLCKFVRTVLFAGVKDEDLPEHIWSDEHDGDVTGWYSGSIFEILGPPISES